AYLARWWLRRQPLPKDCRSWPVQSTRAGASRRIVAGFAALLAALVRAFPRSTGPRRRPVFVACVSLAKRQQFRDESDVADLNCSGHLAESLPLCCPGFHAIAFRLVVSHLSPKY